MAIEIIKEPDVLQMVKDRETDLDLRYKVMDETKKLLFPSKYPYELMGFDGVKIKNAIHTTLPGAANFARNVISELQKTTFQWYVDGDIVKGAKSKVEKCLMAVADQTDEGLINSGTASLKSWLSSHVAVRSLIGMRFISQIVKEKYTVDCLPMDMRYVAWEFGQDGLAWFSYRTRRSQRLIKAEYQVDVEDKLAEVVDVWTPEKNYVYVGGKLLEGFPQKHKFGKPPGVIVLPSSGYMLRDEGFMEDESPDILYLYKVIYEAKNRNASILQTKAMDTIQPAMVDQREQPDASPAVAPPESGQVKKKGLKEPWIPLPRPDLTPALQAGIAQINNEAEDTGYTALDTGRGESSDTAIKISTQYEIRQKYNKVLIEALQVFYGQWGRMIMEQGKIISRGGESELKIGGQGKKLGFSFTSLPELDDYTIKARLMTKNKQLEIANASLASALKGIYPKRWIVENLMMTDEPEKVLRELDIEKSREIDPAFDWLEIANGYAEEIDNAEGVEAELIEVKFYQAMDNYKKIMEERNNPVPVASTGLTKKPGSNGAGNTNALAALAARGG